jgi:hypothetical protein
MLTVIHGIDSDSRGRPCPPGASSRGYTARYFEFVVNMKTAAALGIIFPHEIMLQVTEVIQ